MKIFVSILFFVGLLSRVVASQTVNGKVEPSGFAIDGNGKLNELDLWDWRPYHWIMSTSRSGWGIGYKVGRKGWEIKGTFELMEYSKGELPLWKGIFYALFTDKGLDQVEFLHVPVTKVSAESRAFRGAIAFRAASRNETHTSNYMGIEYDETEPTEFQFRIRDRYQMWVTLHDTRTGGCLGVNMETGPEVDCEVWWIKRAPCPHAELSLSNYEVEGPKKKLGLENYTISSHGLWKSVCVFSINRGYNTKAERWCSMLEHSTSDTRRWYCTYAFRPGATYLRWFDWMSGTNHFVVEFQDVFGQHVLDPSDEVWPSPENH